jgi:hypothetical protein
MVTYNTNNKLQTKYGIFIVKNNYKKDNSTDLVIYLGSTNVVINIWRHRAI